MVTRRAIAQLLAGTALATGLGRLTVTRAYGADKVVKVGIDLSLTGADATGAARIRNGALLAFEQANAKHEIPGYHIDVLTYDDGTATSGQYDPAQAATNARKMVSDPQVMAAVGPQMSGAGKAMSPILSQGDLATITPSSTNPDISNPRFAEQYRPAGKPIYFRTVTTDAYQGPNMANYMAEVLKVKTVYVLDDSGAYGVGLADAFQKQAEKKGMKVLGRDRLDPKAADYTPVFTKIKSLNPDGLYYGGVAQAGVKVVKESYDILPKTIAKAGGDGMYGPDILTGGGFPAAEGWYATIASPHLVDDKRAQTFVEQYKERFKSAPDDYSITAYDAGLVIIAAMKKVAESGKPMKRDAVREAIQTAKVPTIQGTVSFDANGDLADRTVSIFQIHHDSSKPLDDVTAQYKYVAVAPQA
jgi:branched-chain amino acid transport system substrate-binding protein